MPDQPQLSVVIPAYNAEKYLGAAIESVLAQGHPSAEIVVVNDGSSDRTREVAQSYGNQVQCLSQDHAGAAAARNRGVEAARGTYLAFLDADDLWLQGKLALQWAALQSTDGMIFGHIEQFLSPDVPSEVLAKYRCDSVPAPGRVAGTLLLRKNHFLEAGLFKDWRTGEFIEWYDRARQKNFGEVMLPQTLLRRRIHGENMTLRESNIGGDYLRVVKSILDRKKQ